MNRDVFPNDEWVSRRHFARDLVATTAMALMPNGVVAAEQKKVPTALAEMGPRPEGLSTTDWDEVHAKYLNILRVYEDRLSAQEKHSLVNILTTNQHMLISIKSFEVQNGDPSACTLRIATPKNS
jgi:hypothetical protein